MGTVSTAVGCAVGIPIGVGLIVAFAFWYRLQRRFKRELEDDKELEREIFDESAFVSFNNLDSIRQEQQPSGKNNNNNSNNNFTSRDELTSQTDEATENAPGYKRKSNVYIPAYRRKINSLQQYSQTHTQQQQQQQQQQIDPYNNHSTNENISPPLLSQSNQDLRDNTTRQLSVYDQMVPFVNPQSVLEGSKQNNIIDHISMRSDSTIPNNNTLNLSTPQKNDTNLIRNLQYQDLGSYYPGAPPPASTATSFQNFKINTSTSSLNNSTTNIFNTPTSKRSNPYLNNSSSNDEGKNKYTNDNNTSTTHTDLESTEDHYILKNNYDVNDNGRRISEEDQYENEFTNYKENRRQFLDSLRPE